MIISLTGTFGMPRDELVRRLQARGFVVRDISARTRLAVVGKNPNPVTLQAIVDMATPTLNVVTGAVVGVADTVTDDAIDVILRLCDPEPVRANVWAWILLSWVLTAVAMAWWVVAK